MEKDASNPFHYMNESQFEVKNALLNGSTTTIVNGHNLYEEFCVRGKSYITNIKFLSFFYSKHIT